MPRGDKSSYTDKQKRQARHIEQGYEERGVAEEEAAERAWRTVNKQDGGGKQSGSGRAAKSGARKQATPRSGARKKAATKARAANVRGKESGSGKSRSTKR